MPFLASQPTPSPPDPRHTTPRPTQHQPWKKPVPGAPGGRPGVRQWPRSSLAWGLRAVHRWEKVPPALGPMPPARGHQGGRWKRRKRRGRRINAGAKRGAGPAETRSPLHTRSTSPSTHTHTRVRTLRHKSTHGHTLKHIYTHTQLYMCTSTHAHTYTRTHSLVHMCHAYTKCLDTCGGTHMLTHTHSLTYTWAQHTHVDRHMHCTLMYPRVYTCIHSATPAGTSRSGLTPTLPRRPVCQGCGLAGVRERSGHK